ncbi:MAG: hypothetical protein FJ125_09785, partial [Deltaproteobacteria bacterium]|nr:hypothetical protein [Deltaproteobacteria bacterium]
MAEPTVAGAGSGEATGSLLPQVHALLHRLAHPAALLAWAPPALPGAEGAGGPGRPTGPGGDFAGAELRILLLRPSPLRQVSGSATHLLVQALLARHPGVFVDLAFLPEPADLPLLQRAGLSPAFGLLSGQHARAFDVVAFSNSALLELANIPYLLDRCGLLAPLGQRLADRRLPLLLLLLLLLGGA